MIIIKNVLFPYSLDCADVLGLVFGVPNKTKICDIVLKKVRHT